MVTGALFKMTAGPLLAADIGVVNELRGDVRIMRDTAVTAAINTGIEQYDEVATTQSRVSIQFLDESIVRLSEHSELTIDEYIFDPDPSKSSLAINFVQGTARFVTGQLGAINKENFKLKTPSCDVAIRGTSLSITVDELGRSLVMLLPDYDGSPSGEITVNTMAGTVILDQPFQATSVSVFENAPSPPVILDVTLEQIDNMLIVNPPKRIQEQIVAEETSNTADFLDYDELDLDYLAEDSLAEDQLEFTELDINYLDVNFLEDMLSKLDALAVEEEEDQLSRSVNVQVVGTMIGKDPTTQIVTIIEGQTVSLRRHIEHSARVDVTGSVTVTLVQDNVSNVVKVNGGNRSNITIKQGS